MADNTPSHYEASLQRDIDLIKSKINDMFQLDKRALEDSLKALVEGNKQLAYGVILRDQQVDELEKEVDRLCLEFMVRQQPVSVHLRFAYVTIKINQELERIGDYAESIARQVLKTREMNPKPPLDSFVKIADLTIDMLDKSVKAFLDQDLELARKTIEIEEQVDVIRNQIKVDLKARQKEGEIALELMNPFLTIARRFERTSDQAQNICEEVVYMCSGEYAKHIGSEIYRILLVDDHNSCRSQMAEAIGNSMNLPKLMFASAGLDPQPIEKDTIEFLSEKGVDISKHNSKSVDQVPNLDHFNLIIALSDASKKVFPKPPTKVIGLDWQCEDPSAVEGSDDKKRVAFEETYQYIATHLQDLSEAILGDHID